MAGDYAVLHDNAQDYLAFTRSTDGQRCLIVLNFSEQPHTVQVDLAHRQATCLFSTAKESGVVCPLSALELAGFEIFIGELLAE